MNCFLKINYLLVFCCSEFCIFSVLSISLLIVATILISLQWKLLTAATVLPNIFSLENVSFCMKMSNITKLNLLSFDTIHKLHVVESINGVRIIKFECNCSYY